MSDVPAKYEGLSRWSFGDSPELADELLALVLAGMKTATCGALWQYEKENWPLPKAGDLSVVLDGAKRPCCVIETTGAEVKRFDEVDEKFAHDEGEGDRTYRYWREAHEGYFRRQGPFTPDMLVVCERFRVVEKLPLKESVR